MFTSTKTPATIAALVPMGADDFTPLPAKSFHYRGVELTRSTCIRAIKSGVLKSRLLRQPGSTKGRRYILTESLDSYLADCMVDVPPVKEPQHRDTATTLPNETAAAA